MFWGKCGQEKNWRNGFGWIWKSITSRRHERVNKVEKCQKSQRWAINWAIAYTANYLAFGQWSENKSKTEKQTYGSKFYCHAIPWREFDYLLYLVELNNKNQNDCI